MWLHGRRGLWLCRICLIVGPVDVSVEWGSRCSFVVCVHFEDFIMEVKVYWCFVLIFVYTEVKRMK